MLAGLRSTLMNSQKTRAELLKEEAERKQRKKLMDRDAEASHAQKLRLANIRAVRKAEHKNFEEEVVRLILRTFPASRLTELAAEDEACPHARPRQLLAHQC